MKGDYLYNPELEAIIKMIKNDATDEELADKLKHTTFRSDTETDHMCTDDIMEELLIKVGYEKLIEQIRKRIRWYA